MKFLLDEGVPFRLATFLSDHGHDVAAVGRDHPRSLDDSEILAIAVAEQRVIITNDKDFGDLVILHQLPHAGIVLFRMGYLPIDARIASMQRVLIDHDADLQQRKLIVITPAGVRVR